MAERDIVVIGASRGGFQGLKMLVSQLPADLPAAVFIVLHIGRHASVLPDLLSAWGPLTARYATHGETVQRGTIRVAPPDRHLVLSKGRVWLNDGAKENFARPAADPLFRSAALEYGPRVIGVVMSGDLDDGAAGLANIRAQQGFAIVQDPADCESPGMPRAALESCGADALCPEHDLSRCILDAVKGVQAGGVSKEATMSKDVLAQEARIAASGISDPAALDEVGERSALTCPDCGGALWRIQGRSSDALSLPYRARVHRSFAGRWHRVARGGGGLVRHSRRVRTCHLCNGTATLGGALGQSGTDRDRTGAHRGSGTGRGPAARGDAGHDAVAGMNAVRRAAGP